MKDLDEDLERAREVTRELHAATKDARAALRDLDKHKQMLTDALVRRFEEEASEVVRQGLTRYQESLDRHINEATEAVYRRFDTIRDLLLGEDKRARARGDLTIEEAAVLRRALSILDE